MVSIPLADQPDSRSHIPAVRPFGGSKLQDGQSMVKPTSCAAWGLEETIRYIRDKRQVPLTCGGPE